MLFINFIPTSCKCKMGGRGCWRMAGYFVNYAVLLLATCSNDVHSASTPNLLTNLGKQIRSGCYNASYNTIIIINFGSSYDVFCFSLVMEVDLL